MFFIFNGRTDIEKYFKSDRNYLFFFYGVQNDMSDRPVNIFEREQIFNKIIQVLSIFEISDYEIKKYLPVL